jgi:hypothetical protein
MGQIFVMMAKDHQGTRTNWSVPIIRFPAMLQNKVLVQIETQELPLVISPGLEYFQRCEESRMRTLRPGWHFEQPTSGHDEPL